MPGNSNSNNPLKRYAHGSAWALVTGATGGMGEEWSHQLAALGFNVILHGRNQSKLDSVQSAIQAKYSSVEIRTAVADASACPPRLQQLRQVFDSKDIHLTVVVNNIGVVSQSYPLLEEVTEEELLAQLSVNTLFPTMVAQQTLPILKRNQPSLMVNVSSLGAWAPTPYLTPYSGAKAYNLKFSHSLYNEQICEGTKVDVVAMVPGQVVSGMNEGPPTTMMPLSEAWVKKAISSLSPGLFSSRPAPVIIPWPAHAWGNRIMCWMGRSLGDSTVRNVTLDMRKKKTAASGAKGNGATKAETATANGSSSSEKHKSSPSQPSPDATESTEHTRGLGTSSTAGTAVEEGAADDK